MRMSRRQVVLRKPCEPCRVSSRSPAEPPSVCFIDVLLLLFPCDLSSSQQGEHARMASFIGAIAIADLVKTTLGPKGMDKILQSVSLWLRILSHHACPFSPTRSLLFQVSTQDGSITVTNDGATILKAVHIDNPAAKVLVDIAKTQVKLQSPFLVPSTKADRASTSSCVAPANLRLVHSCIAADV
jgi:hypothetical protein